MPAEGEVRVNRLDPSRRAVFRGGQWYEEGGGSQAAPGGPKARPDFGPGMFELPNGDIAHRGPKGGFSIVSRGKDGTGGSSPADLKEFQINAAARATLMDEGERSYQEARRAGYSPNNPLNAIARNVEDWPVVGKPVANLMRNDAAEKARAAELQFNDGALRTTTGANAPEPEVVRAERAYFQQPGENDRVEADRRRLRERFRNTSIRAAGPAYLPGDQAIPHAARASFEGRFKSGKVDKTAPRGSETRPYIAVSDEIANRLPKNAWVVLPDGTLRGPQGVQPASTGGARVRRYNPKTGRIE